MTVSRHESIVFFGQISSWDSIPTLTGVLQFDSEANHLKLVQTP